MLPVTPGPVGSPRQQGVALAMLLWFIAAMMVLVASIAMQARVDIRLTQLHAERARAAALGDGAIQLAVAELRLLESQGEFDSSLGFAADYVLDGKTIDVVFQPLAGLIDLNLASEELLFALFLSAAGSDESRAAELAANVIEWRTSAEGAEEEAGNLAASLSGPEGFIRGARLEAIEDLLMVPGIDRAIFDAVRDSVYVGQRGQRGVDWVVAPAGVLQALGGYSPEEAEALYNAIDRSDRAGQSAPAELDLSFQEGRSMSSYRVDARVVAGDNAFMRRRWVEVNRNGFDGLPWRFVRTEAVRFAAGGAHTLDAEESDADF